MQPASSSPAARNLGAGAAASAPIFHPMYAQCLVRAATRIEAQTRELLSKAKKIQSASGCNRKSAEKAASGVSVHVHKHGDSNDG